MKSTLFRYTSLALLAALLLSGRAPQAEPPNIIFILTDDHAQQAISAYGSTLIQTPNIDRLAREGAIFENSFVTNSICAPSRAVFLTGKYSHLNSVRDNRDTFDGSQLTFPKLLQQAGYYTSIVGKWHLKSLPTGFDYWNVLIGQGDYYNPTMINMGDTIRYEGYTTELITDLALEQLQNRPKGKPFCMLYQHKAPHRNFMPGPKQLGLFEKDTFPLPSTFFDDYAGRPAAEAADMRIADMYMGFDMKLMPEDYQGYQQGTGGKATFDQAGSWQAAYEALTPEQRKAWQQHYGPIRKEFIQTHPEGKALATWKFQRYLRDYLGSVAAVDDQIGRILQYLDENGLADNTIVVYSSDQGFYLGEHGWYDKRFMYEPSLRTPLIIRYPKKIKPGRSVSQMVLNLDMAPTLLDFAGLVIPEDIQGASMKPLLTRKKAKNWRDAIYYHYYEYPHGWHDVHTHYGVRTERYKLIHFYGALDHWELYDLAEDRDELHNLYGAPAYATIQKELMGKLTALQQQYKDPISNGN